MANAARAASGLQHRLLRESAAGWPKVAHCLGINDGPGATGDRTFGLTTRALAEAPTERRQAQHFPDLLLGGYGRRLQLALLPLPPPGNLGLNFAFDLSERSVPVPSTQVSAEMGIPGYDDLDDEELNTDRSMHQDWSLASQRAAAAARRPSTQSSATEDAQHTQNYAENEVAYGYGSSDERYSAVGGFTESDYYYDDHEKEPFTTSLYDAGTVEPSRDE